MADLDDFAPTYADFQYKYGREILMVEALQASEKKTMICITTPGD